MKSYLAQWSVLLASLTSMAPLLASDETEAPILYHPREVSPDEFECEVQQVPVKVCYEKSGFSLEERSILGRGVAHLYGVLIMSRPSLNKCLQDSPQKPTIDLMIQALDQFFQWNGDPRDLNNLEVQTQLPLLYISRFRENTGRSFQNNFVFAFPGFYDSIRLTGKPYALIGISNQFQSRNSVTGSNTAFWAAMTTLGLLTNFGHTEDASPVWKSPVHQIAQCVMYRGEVPEEHKLPSLRGR